MILQDPLWSSLSRLLINWQAESLPHIILIVVFAPAVGAYAGEDQAGHEHEPASRGEPAMDNAAMRVAASITCPEYCNGTVLAECSVEHRKRYGAEIARLMKEGLSDNAIIALFARKYGVHVLNAVVASKRGQSSEVGTITGVLVDAGKEDTPAVPGAKLKIMAYAGDSEVEVASPTSDEQGKFRAEHLAIRRVAAFRAATTYQGVEYTSGWAILPVEQPAADLVLRVYPITDDTAAISISHHHMMLDVDDQNLLVTEVVIAVNAGNKTAVSRDAASGTFKLLLPKGAKDIRLVNGFDEKTSVTTGGKVVFTGPFQPGQKRFTVQYSIPFSEETLVISRRLNYDAAAMDFIFPDSDNLDTLVRSDDYTTQRRIAMGRRAYQMLSATDRKAGDTLNVEITGLPVRPANPFKWPALVMAGIIVAGVAVSLCIRSSEPARLRRGDTR